MKKQNEYFLHFSTPTVSELTKWALCVQYVCVALF